MSIANAGLLYVTFLVVYGKILYKAKIKVDFSYTITNEKNLNFFLIREVKVVCQKVEDAVAVVSDLEMTVAGL